MEQINFFLITGFMGAGKTFLGSLAAEKLAIAFVDLDEYIEANTGRAITTIFAESGESCFRKIEHDCLAQLLAAARTPLIIAAGGGLPTYEPSQQLMKLCSVIFLDTPLSAILSRIELLKFARPLLHGLETSQIVTLYNARRQIYLHSADFVVSEETRLIEVIANLTSGAAE